MAATVIPRPPWCLTPGSGSATYNNQQSANILGDCCMRRCQEWGTMAAVVGHLGHDVSTVVNTHLLAPYRPGGRQGNNQHNNNGTYVPTLLAISMAVAMGRYNTACIT